MTKGTLGQVVKRAISDAAFRRQLQSDPEGALKGFDLSSDERAALRSGDAAKLSGFGVDQRMSKAFALGEGAAVTARSNTELSESSGARAAFIDQDTSDGSGALAGLIDPGGSIGRAALADGDRLAQVNAAFEGGDRAGGVRALGDQHDGGRAAIGGNPAGGQSALDGSGDAGRDGTTYITADEAGRDFAPAASASSDSSANTAFMTSDEMGTGVTGAQSTDGDNASDALPVDTSGPWSGYENPEHQG